MSGKIITEKEFIERCKKVNPQFKYDNIGFTKLNRGGDKYDYSKSKYYNNKTKLTIICPEHGEFEQMPGSHLSWSECPTCMLC